jgi:low temperature requirement protein LtrA
MSTVEEAARATGADEDVEERVSPLELFFDLVFVFAITQVTALMSEHPTWEGLAQGMLVLAAIWWAWVAYAWMTNVLDTDEGLVRLSVFAVMATMLVAALAVPNAFAGDGVLFGVCYLIVRVLHLVVYAQGSHGDHDLVAQIKRFAPTSVIGPTLIIIAGTFDDVGVREVLWLAALALDYGGAVLAGMSGWRVSPGHFAERHGLIIIIALGESIVSIGIGLSGVDLGAGEITAAVLGVAIAAALWWTYFDVVAVVAERMLRQAKGIAQVKLARDSYSYLHLPMVAGIVLVSLGIKKAIGHVDEPLKTVPAFALCAGPALYYLAHVAFRWRNRHTLALRRIVVAAILLAFIPVAHEADALFAIAAVAAIEAGLLLYEVIRFRDSRSRLYSSLKAGA